MTVNVDHAIFTNTATSANTSGIIMSNVHLPQITRNEINLSAYEAKGIFLNESKHYSIKNNLISSLVPGSGIGILVEHSKGGRHRVYRNDLNDLFVGIYAGYENSGVLPAWVIRMTGYG
ncbi:MAG TPA: NosD domain-containing protein [Chitinophagaceae bacterium]|nr:NosD domain-containing protein [Chitinophagaceae bacterium]